MSDQKTADNEPVRDVDWYLGVYRASQELKDRSYRTVGPMLLVFSNARRSPSLQRTRSSA